MKKNKHFPLFIIFVAIGLTAFINTDDQTGNIKGAWKRTVDSGEEVLQFMDGYFTHSGYDKNGRKFFFTRGGTYEHNNNELTASIEFNSRNPDEVGKTHVVKTTISGNTL